MKRILTLLLVLFQIAAVTAVTRAQEDEGQFYQETILSMPEGHRLLSMGAEPDGAILARSLSGKNTHCFLRWRDIGMAPEVIPVSFEGLEVWNMDIAPDGGILLSVGEPEADDSGTTPRQFIWADASGQETTRLELRYDSDYISWKALPGRRIAVRSQTGNNDLVIYDEKGAEVRRESIQYIQGMLSGTDTLYVFASGAIFAIPLDANERMYSYPLSMSPSGQTAVGPDGTIYTTSDDGIYALNLAEGAAVKRMKAFGTALGDPDMDILHLYALPDGSFVIDTAALAIGVIRSNLGADSNYIAVYRPQDETTSRTPFVITRMNESTALIQKATSAFQKAHPELDVQLRTLNNYHTGGMLTDDLIRTINTELLAGGGGDVLVLDSLPVKAIIDRGMLRDLSYLVPDLGLLPGIAEGSKHTDGKVYAIPAEFAANLLWGNKDAIADIHTFADILAVPVGQDQTRLSAYALKFQTALLIASCMRDFCDEQGQISFTSPDFIVFLELLCDINSEMDMQSDADGFTLLNEEKADLENGNIALYPHQAYSFFNLDIYYTLFGKEEAGVIAMPSMHERGKAYVPGILLSIPTVAKNQALSEEFIRLVLSEEMLSYGFAVNFPTVQTSLDMVFQDALERSRDEKRNTTSIGDVTGKIYVYHVPDEAFLAALRAVMDGLTEPLDVDTKVLGFILEQIDPLFAGEITAEEAAKAIEQRAWLYMHE